MARFGERHEFTFRSFAVDRQLLVLARGLAQTDDDQEIQRGDDRKRNDEREQRVRDEPVQFELFLAALVRVLLDQHEAVGDAREDDDGLDHVMQQMDVLLHEDAQRESDGDEPLNGEMSGEARR